MKTSPPSLRGILAALLVMAALAGNSRAALVLTVSEFTSTHITISVSGTLDADTTGTLNLGTFFVAPSSDLTTQWYSGALAIVDDTMTVGGSDAYGAFAENDGLNTGYSIFWGQSSPPGPGFSVAAGTAVSGTVRATGTIDNVNFYASDFKLYSGQTASKVAGRLEAVPEPSSALFAGIGVLGVLSRRRRRAVGALE